MKILIAEDEIEEQELSIYPNPATEFIMVKSHNRITNVTIFDSLGRIVLSFNPKNQLYKSLRFNTTGFKAGIYYLLLDHIDDTNSLEKLIVAK